MEDRIMLSPTSSLRNKLKHSICGCFNKGHDHDALHHHRLEDQDHYLSPSSPSSHNHHFRPRLTRSSSSGGGGSHWGSFGGGGGSDSNLKNKCKHLISRMGHHRKSRSTDFRYDSVSYALNFDDSAHLDDDGSMDEYPLKSFSARLPPSPPPMPPHPHHLTTHHRPVVSDSAISLPTPPPPVSVSAPAATPSPPPTSAREIAACS